MTNDEIDAELAKLTTQDKREMRACPDCGRPMPVLQVKKIGTNTGRPFVTCQSCETFQWCDVPCCTKCGRNLLKLTVKKSGPNQGRQFFACPIRCDGQFQWIF